MYEKDHRIGGKEVGFSAQGFWRYLRHGNELNYCCGNQTRDLMKDWTNVAMGRNQLCLKNRVDSMHDYCGSAEKDVGVSGLRIVPWWLGK